MCAVHILPLACVQARCHRRDVWLSLSRAGGGQWDIETLRLWGNGTLGRLRVTGCRGADGKTCKRQTGKQRTSRRASKETMGHARVTPRCACTCARARLRACDCA
eukprot:8825202-Alexandrium_andersonii.AAC.1